MCIDCECDTWFDLTRVGLQGEGCIRNQAFLSSIRVPCTHNPINQHAYIQTATKTLQWVSNLPGSTFSRVELGVRQTSLPGQPLKSQTVFIKRPLLPGKSLLHEACIQQIVKDSLDRGKFVRGAAAVHDIFRLGDGSVAFSMEIFEDATPLSVLLKTLATTDLTAMILELLFQLSAMMRHLHTDIGMNHRDLKPSNIMIESHEPRPLRLTLDGDYVTIQSRFTISLVDFGFSCIGKQDTQKSDITIGDVYSVHDPCPKDGRDLYMFLAFLYMDCGKRMSSDLRIYFAKWLQNDVTGVISKIDRLGHEFNTWIYFIGGNERIRQFDCNPKRIFTDLRLLAQP